MIGEIVMESLTYNTVAYVRFASVYKNFKLPMTLINFKRLRPPVSGEEE